MYQVVLRIEARIGQQLGPYQVVVRIPDLNLTPLPVLEVVRAAQDLAGLCGTLPDFAAL